MRVSERDSHRFSCFYIIGVRPKLRGIVRHLFWVVVLSVGALQVHAQEWPVQNYRVDGVLETGYWRADVLVST